MPQETLVKRIIAEYSETCDEPADFHEVQFFVGTLRAMIKWCKLPVPSNAALCVMFLQRTRFSWDILAKGMNEYGISFDDNWEVPSAEELRMCPTTGFVNLDSRIPKKVICSAETGLPLSEVIFVNEGKQWKGYEPSEFVGLVLDMYKQTDGLVGTAYGGNSPEAKGFLHDCSVKALIANQPPLPSEEEEDVRAGLIVSVLTESPDGDRKELFLVTEVNDDTVGGFWLYEEDDVPQAVLETQSERSFEEDAHFSYIYFSDHFDVVYKDSLLAEESSKRRRNTGTSSTDCKTCRVPVDSLVPRLKGAYSHSHGEILNIRGLDQFMAMLKKLDTCAIDESGLGLFRNTNDRVSCILPGGIDSSLDRAQDLSGLLWSGGCDLTEIEPVPANCDCCGLDRTISFVLNDMLYLGSSCANKIRRLAPEILRCRDLAKNPAHLLNPFRYTTEMAIID